MRHLKWKYMYVKYSYGVQSLLVKTKIVSNGEIKLSYKFDYRICLCINRERVTVTFSKMIVVDNIIDTCFLIQ